MYGIGFSLLFHKAINDITQQKLNKFKIPAIVGLVVITAIFLIALFLRPLPNCDDGLCARMGDILCDL